MKTEDDKVPAPSAAQAEFESLRARARALVDDPDGDPSELLDSGVDVIDGLLQALERRAPTLHPAWQGLAVPADAVKILQTLPFDVSVWPSPSRDSRAVECLLTEGFSHWNARAGAAHRDPLCGTHYGATRLRDAVCGALELRAEACEKRAEACAAEAKRVRRGSSQELAAQRSREASGEAALIRVTLRLLDDAWPAAVPPSAPPADP